MYLKIRKDKDWQFGRSIEYHLVEINREGLVQRFIDLDAQERIVDFSPSERDVYGVTDHPRLTTDPGLDINAILTEPWSQYEMSAEEFESFWEQAIATDKKAT